MSLRSKPRCVYANEKLSGNVKTNVDYLIADGECACGGSFVDEESYLHHSVVVRRQLTYASPIEATYYSTKHALQPLQPLRWYIRCAYCR